MADGYVQLVAAYRAELHERFPWLDSFRLGMFADRWARTDLANRIEDAGHLVRGGRLAEISHHKEAWARSIEDAIAELEAEGEARATSTDVAGDFEARMAALRVESQRPVRCAALFRLLHDVAVAPSSEDPRGARFAAWTAAAVAAGLVTVDGQRAMAVRDGVTDRDLARAFVDAGAIAPWRRDGEDDLGVPVSPPRPAVPIRPPLGRGAVRGELEAGPAWDLPPEWRPDEEDDDG